MRFQSLSILDVEHQHCILTSGSTNRSCCFCLVQQCLDRFRSRPVSRSTISNLQSCPWESVRCSVSHSATFQRASDDLARKQGSKAFWFKKPKLSQVNSCFYCWTARRCKFYALLCWLTQNGNMWSSLFPSWPNLSVPSCASSSRMDELDLGCSVLAKACQWSNMQKKQKKMNDPNHITYGHTDIRTYIHTYSLEMILVFAITTIMWNHVTSPTINTRSSFLWVGFLEDVVTS